MKHIFFILLVMGSISTYTQNAIDLNIMKPEGDFENIHIKKLSTDSLSTSFVIWIKNKVGLHKHEWHSETLYVLEGSGNMTIGNNTFSVKQGDFFKVPKNTAHALDVTSEMIKVLSVQAPEFKGNDRVILKKASETLD